MNRSIGRWEACTPSAMATQSKAAITFAFEDAKEDIAELATQNTNLLSALKRIEKALGNYNPAFPMAPGYFAEYEAAMTQAREAITKAGV